jgi:hypothetical protein
MVSFVGRETLNKMKGNLLCDLISIYTNVRCPHKEGKRIAKREGNAEGEDPKKNRHDSFLLDKKIRSSMDRILGNDVVPPCLGFHRVHRPTKSLCVLKQCGASGHGHAHGCFMMEKRVKETEYLPRFCGCPTITAELIRLLRDRNNITMAPRSDIDERRPRGKCIVRGILIVIG